MKTENYPSTIICSKAESRLQALFPSFRSTRKITDNAYAVEQDAMFFRCDTPLQCAAATMDNSKVWFNLFIQIFMVPNLDMERVSFIETDTDSIYVNVAGDPNHPKGINQGFEAVKRPGFDTEYPKWFADPATVEDEKRTKMEKWTEEKKLLAVSIERVGTEMIALAPKCYSIHTEEGFVMKNKGVCVKDSDACAKAQILTDSGCEAMTFNHYKVPLFQGQFLSSSSKQLRLVKEPATATYRMKKLEIVKQSLTAIHTKMVVLPNDCCAPFIWGVSAARYIVAPRGWTPSISLTKAMGPVPYEISPETPQPKRRPLPPDYCIDNLFPDASAADEPSEAEPDSVS
jgi:hypothetical protein